ncbi:nuclear receptor co-repressor 1 [Ascosphaera acerosa]|nr:nuclear receptor co-repressor 1 [Ascosphaera acerosa]
MVLAALLPPSHRRKRTRNHLLRSLHVAHEAVLAPGANKQSTTGTPAPEAHAKQKSDADKHKEPADAPAATVAAAAAGPVAGPATTSAPADAVSAVTSTSSATTNATTAAASTVAGNAATGAAHVAPPSRPRGGKSRAKTEGITVFDSTEVDLALKRAAPYGSTHPTSYWSVQEIRDFPALLAHFGRDFEGISDFMKIKTATMCKNYFQRCIDVGKDYAAIADSAEGQKARGETTAPLPTGIDGKLLAERLTLTPHVPSNMPLHMHAPAEELTSLRSSYSQPAAYSRGPRLGYFEDDRRSVRGHASLPLIPPPVPQEPATVNSQPDVLDVHDVRFHHQQLSRSHGPSSGSGSGAEPLPSYYSSLRKILSRASASPQSQSRYLHLHKQRRLDP